MFSLPFSLNCPFSKLRQKDCYKQYIELNPRSEYLGMTEILHRNILRYLCKVDGFCEFTKYLCKFRNIGLHIGGI